MDDKKIDLVLVELKKIFDKIEKNSEQVEEKFEQIDARFDKLENRFDNLEKRFDRFEEKNEAEHRNIFNILNSLTCLNDLIAQNSFRISILEQKSQQN